MSCTSENVDHFLVVSSKLWSFASPLYYIVLIVKLQRCGDRGRLAEGSSGPDASLVTGGCITRAEGELPEIWGENKQFDCLEPP